MFLLTVTPPQQEQQFSSHHDVIYFMSTMNNHVEWDMQGRRRPSNECLLWKLEKLDSFSLFSCVWFERREENGETIAGGRADEEIFVLKISNDKWLSAFMASNWPKWKRVENWVHCENSNFFSLCGRFRPLPTLKFHTHNPFNQIALNRSINFL